MNFENGYSESLENSGNSTVAEVANNVSSNINQPSMLCGYRLKILYSEEQLLINFCFKYILETSKINQITRKGSPWANASKNQ